MSLSVGTLSNLTVTGVVDMGIGARTISGSAITPGYAFSSETSLGFFRSAASIIRQSYGTFVTSSLSVDGGDVAITAAGAGMVLLDNGTGNVGVHLRMRDSSNNDRWAMGLRGASGVLGTAWIHSALSGAWGDILILTQSGQALHPAGTALLPPVAFSSESSLGWYRSGSSTLALSYGTINLTAGGAVISIASLTIKSGTNNSCGTAVLGSNGSVNVANTYVKTGDLIFLTDQTPGGTLGDLEILGIRNSSGFTIASTGLTDTSTVAWLIVRPG